MSMVATPSRLSLLCKKMDAKRRSAVGRRCKAKSRRYLSEIGVVEGLVLTVIRAAGATRGRRVDGRLDGSRRVTFGPSVSIERCNLPADASRVFIRVSVVETHGCRISRSWEHISASAHLAARLPMMSKPDLSNDRMASFAFRCVEYVDTRTNGVHVVSRNSGSPALGARLRSVEFSRSVDRDLFINVACHRD
jgi:hypothetical protein